MGPEHDDEIAEWLFRYRSYDHRRDVWKELKEQQPDVAEAFMKDARRLRLFFNSLP